MKLLNIIKTFELKNRGVEDVLIFDIDGLNGFNQVIQAVYPILCEKLKFNDV